VIGLEPLLSVENLGVEIPTRHGRVRAAQGVSFQVGVGERLGIVGESGSGKTITALALMRLLLPPAEITSGKIRVGESDVLGLNARELTRFRGGQAAMIFQDPLTALNPFLRVGLQVAESLELHRGMRRREALAEAARLLERVQISDAERRLREYPHQLSGGMRQRVAIAIAMATKPRLIIADEPTTALDVTAQANVLDLLRELASEDRTAVILISHDLAVVSDFCDRVLVMYAGRVVEEGSVDEVVERPRHPYTRALLRSIPRLDRGATERLTAIPGAPPDLARPIVGCAFAPRCPLAVERCRSERPELAARPGGGRVACHRADEVETLDGAALEGRTPA
jgi:oligopeptide/dipeptide ABC transporter ATP-binding protein